MPKVFTSKTQKIGEIGENIAVKFLMKQGFAILERNYTKKWGEIDIIAKKDNKIYFIEVKSVSRNLINVSQETLDSYKPEDNMHPWKLKRMSRTIQTYLLAHKEYDEYEWQIDLITVFLDLIDKKAKVKRIEDIIL
ncbi:MAG: YraN family protein [Candidatus Pacebacteria bacterium]|nr:YraN family protein [Candidatus Paceibacterota bacterium]